MLLVSLMPFFLYQHPFVDIYLREEGVHLVKGVVYACHVEPIGQWQGGTVDPFTPDDEHELFIVGGGKCLFQGAHHGTAGVVVGVFVGGEDDVPSIG